MAPEGSGEVIWMRPERAATGRPAQRSRAEITEAAVAIADGEGLAAVSMRRVAAQLGTGAASLYRYVDTREDLLDLMTDATGAEYSLVARSGDWLADLLGIGQQARGIMRRHPWLPLLVITRPVLGPNGLRLAEHILDVLAPHPAALPAKLEALALLSSVTALFAQHELAGGSAAEQRYTGYLIQAAASGAFPRLAGVLTLAPPAALADDRYPGVMARILTGLLGPGPAGA